MNQEAFDALRAVINFGRNYPKRSAESCRKHLESSGFSQDAIDAAIQAWMEYETKKEQK
jgi:hypothetical protein